MENGRLTTSARAEEDPGWAFATFGTRILDREDGLYPGRGLTLDGLYPVAVPDKLTYDLGEILGIGRERLAAPPYNAVGLEWIVEAKRQAHQLAPCDCLGYNCMRQH